MRAVDIWIPGLTDTQNTRRNTRARMARIKSERERAHLCAIVAVRMAYPHGDDRFLGPTRIEFEVRLCRLRDPLANLPGSLKALQDGLCQRVLALGDGPGTPYEWVPPTQVRVKTRAEQGVMVRIKEIAR